MRPNGHALASLFLLRAGPSAAQDIAPIELLVFEDKACGPCILFDRQVGNIYAKTEEAGRAPLRRLPFGQPVPEEFQLDGAIRVAPTFVLVRAGKEVGRFEGYSQDELFWMNFNYLLNQLPAD